MNPSDTPQPSPTPEPAAASSPASASAPEETQALAPAPPTLAKAEPPKEKLRRAIRRKRPKTDAEKRRDARERQQRRRDKVKALKDAELAAQFPPEKTGEQINEAAAAIDAGRARASARAKGKPRQRYTDPPRAERPGGWLREGQLAGAGLSSGQLRDLARRVFEVDGLPYLQEVINDPESKDTDRLRAVDIVAKLAVGYMTPDVMNAEDAPDLPPPIFTTTDGELPGGEAPRYDDAEQTDEPAAMAAAAGGGAPIGPVPHFTSGSDTGDGGASA